MNEEREQLGLWSPESYVSAAIRGQGQSYMNKGSVNALIDGSGFVRASRGPLLLELLGSRLFFIADKEFAGLGDASAAVSGSIISARQLLCYVGSGQVNFAGAAIAGAIASSTFSYIKKSGSVYVAGLTTGPFQAGHAQPSAPIITAKDVPAVGQTPMNAAIAVVIWRISEADNQPSLASLPSNVLVLSNQSLIVQFPLPDSNGQTDWGIGGPKPGFADLGVFYQIPTSLHGIVSEADLSYTRTVTGASIADTTNVVDVTDAIPADQFTSADIGRRFSFGTFDSWITAINSPTQVQVNDTNSSGGTIAGDGTVTHAVDGITRAIEISWTAGALLGQGFAPDKAFPPPAGQFLGAMVDVFFFESDGIIYVSDPGFIGSFPPSNALFPNEPAVAYIRISDELIARFGKTSFGVISYTGAVPALEWHELWHNQGILFPQNVAIGAGGRILLWLGKHPAVIVGTTADLNYATEVLPDFEGWENQTEDTPVSPSYDGIGQYEVWFYLKTAMCRFAPTGKWCAPQDLSGDISDNVVDAVTFQQKCYFATADMNLYQFDAGSGTVMKIQVDDTVESYGDTVSQLYLRGRVDNTDHPVIVELIKNFADDNTADANPILMHTEVPGETGYYAVRSRKKTVLNVKSHAMKITVTSVGGNAGVDVIQTAGAKNQILLGRLAP